MKAPAKRALALALTTSVICLAWFSRPAEHRLMDHAVIVAGIHPGDWRDGYYWHPGNRRDGYCWLSGHDLLLFHRVRALGWTVARRDTRAKMEMPLPTLDALFRQTGGQPQSVKVSPDGGRLIWAGTGKVIYGATVGGHQFQRWPYGQNEVGISYWLNDSRHFLRYTGYDPALAHGARLRGVEDPPGVKSLPWADLDWAVTGPLSPGERLFAEGGGNGGPDDANVTLSRLTVAGVQRTGRNVSLPPGDCFLNLPDARFASEGDALIWTTVRRPPPVLPPPFRSLAARLGWHPKPGRTLGAFVSRADGTRWHFLGDWEETDASGHGAYYDENDPHDFRWVPGGRRMSFEHLGALYVVLAGP